MEQKKHIGGKRRGAGRKPVLNKKKQFSFYVEGVKVVKFGSEEKFKKAVTEFIDEFGQPKEMGIQGLTKPNMEIKPITTPPPQTNVVISTLPPKPMANLFQSFVDEIKNTKTIKEIEEIMRRVKGEAMIPREKMQLESIAKAHAEDKGMYND